VDTDGPTFKQVALDYIALNEAGWKSDEHTHQWKSTLERYVYPRIGNTPIKDVTKHHVRELLLLIWLKKNPTARKVRGRIELVFDYAMGHDLYVGMNPALWRGNLKAVLPEAKDVHKEVHHKSLDYHELPKLVGFLQDRIKSTRSPNSAKALIWTILSGSRYSEVAEATFDEIDLRRNVWVIPAKRMKNGKEHRVPLTPPMVTLFAQLSHERVCDFLFPGIARNDMIFQAMSENTMTKYLQSHTQGNPTVHGMRSTFKSWVLENTKYPDFLSEEQLSHTVGDSVRQAYAHTDLLDMRREMMERWAAFVMGQRQGKVVSIN
jgi:integrase